VRSYERHQLKQDRFAATTAETLTWASEHRRKIVNTAIIAGIAVLLIGGIFWYLRYRESQAKAALASAMDTYNTPVRPAGTPADSHMKSFASEQERAKAAVDAFRPVADKYPHSRSGQMARYFLGLSEQDLGNNAEAEKQLKEAADSRNDDVSSLSKFALASLYRSTQRPADAIKIYKELADHPTDVVPKNSVQLELADLYENTQQTQEANKLYDQIAKGDPRSLAAQIAASKRPQQQQAPAAAQTPLAK
jgi:tetratricopeptide (TPR) repeat protein